MSTNDVVSSSGMDEVGAEAREALSLGDQFDIAGTKIDELVRLIREISGQPGGCRIIAGPCFADLRSVARHLRMAKPRSRCPCCQSGCKACGNKGWVTKAMWDAIDSSLKNLKKQIK